MSQTKPPKGYITPDQAAKIVGCSTSAIRRRVAKGNIKVRRYRRPKGQRGFPWLMFVRKIDVLEMAKEFVKPTKRKNISTPPTPTRTNSSKRDSHKGEVWQIFDNLGTIVFESSFDKCLAYKVGIEEQTGKYHTMRMVGGERNQVHNRDVGNAWDQIDRYKFHTV